MRPVIALLTDFGTQDGFVGTMKGVMKRLSPFVDLVDITNQIPPQDILSACFVLAESAPFFPKDSVFIAVVDPTVGTSRRPIIARNKWGFFVCPDNGILTRVHEKCAFEKVVSIENSRFLLKDQSVTFHGRDVFAPVAAHLSRGEPIDSFGPEIKDMVTLETPKPVHHVNGLIEGQIIHVDFFGNLISNIPYMHIAKGAHAEWSINDNSIVGMMHTYSDVAEGDLTVVHGSHGYCEISVNKGNAALALKAKRGDRIIVTVEKDLV